MTVQYLTNSIESQPVRNLLGFVHTRYAADGAAVSARGHLLVDAPERAAGRANDAMWRMRSSRMALRHSRSFASGSVVPYRLTVSASERATGELSSASVLAGAASLRTHGVVCFEGVLDAKWIERAHVEATGAFERCMSRP